MLQGEAVIRKHRKTAIIKHGSLGAPAPSDIQISVMPWLNISDNLAYVDRIRGDTFRVVLRHPAREHLRVHWRIHN